MAEQQPGDVDPPKKREAVVYNNCEHACGRVGARGRSLEEGEDALPCVFEGWQWFEALIRRADGTTPHQACSGGG